MSRKARGFSVILLLCVVPALLGQGTGTIHGVISDPTGLPVPGARIVATLGERGTTRTVVSSTEGGYVLPLLPIGVYTLRVETGGFKQFTRDGVTLNANENVRVDARLEVGSLSENVTVTAEAPLVDSRSSVLGTLIDSRRVMELPINGRNVMALAQLLPGVSQLNTPQMVARDYNGPTVSVSGSRANENLLLFDGAQFSGHFRNTGLNYPPPDALQEVKVLTNSFSAEYGRNAGSVFNVVSKSGTNQIHGSAWEFLRNQKLNARNFFAPSQKPPLIQNQFGAAAGGPLRRNKLFAFGSWEALRVRPAALGASAFPLTAAERAGDFSGAKAVKDPSTGQPFPNNLIPTSRFDRVAANVLSRGLMPLPTQPDGSLVTTSPNPQNNNTFLVRLDYNLGKHTLDTRYNYTLASEHSFAGQVPSYLPVDRQARTQSLTIGDVLAASPRLVNQARLSLTRMASTIQNPVSLHLSDLGGNFPVIGGGARIPPALLISGRVNLGNASDVMTQNVNESMEIMDSVTWTGSSHSLRAGVDLLRTRFLERSYYNTMGRFNITGAITGNPAADFVLGKAESMIVGSPVTEQEGLQNNTYLFFQDDWKVHPRLTLNLGVRYELSPPWVHPYDWAGTFIRGRQSTVIPSAPLGMVFPGDAGIGRGIRPTDKNNFAPRFGFAWDPFGKGRTSVRGAYGIFYETVNADAFPSSNTQPFHYTFTINAPDSFADPLRGQAPVPLSVDVKNPRFVGVQELPYPDPNMRTPYVQHFHTTVQHEVVKGLSLQVGYVGKLGRKLLMGLSTNPAIYGPGATLANLDQRRIIRPYGNLRSYLTVSNSTYNGLQVEVNKRFSRGFSLQGAYTYSRSVDLSSSITVGTAVPYVFDLSTQKGLADFFAKHIFSGSWIWDLPRLSSSNVFVRAVAGGWQVNGLVSIRSGMPFDIQTGTDNALSGTPSQRPNVTGDPLLAGGRSRGDQILAWFDRAVFSQPATGTYGNVGRNALLGPGASTTNAGLFKTFGLPGHEGMKLQFRSEFFSMFNTPTLGTPENRVSAGTRMGRITSAGGSRVIQLALKLLF